MSQHRFTTMHDNDEIVVTLGWDRPLQGFFMTIIKNPKDGKEDAEQDPVYLFNCLDQDESHPREISGFLFELAHRGIVIPQEVFNEVLSDNTNDVGNKIVDHRYVNGKYVREQSL